MSKSTAICKNLKIYTVASKGIRFRDLTKIPTFGNWRRMAILASIIIHSISIIHFWQLAGRRIIYESYITSDPSFFVH